MTLLREESETYLSHIVPSSVFLSDHYSSTLHFAFRNMCCGKADGGYQRFGVRREGAGCLMELIECKNAPFLQKLEGKRTKSLLW